MRESLGHCLRDTFAHAGCFNGGAYLLGYSFAIYEFASFFVCQCEEIIMAIMKGDNQNVLFFENKSMRSLYDDLNRWRNETGREFSSVNIEKDGDKDKRRHAKATAAGWVAE